MKLYIQTHCYHHYYQKYYVLNGLIVTILLLLQKSIYGQIIKKYQNLFKEELYPELNGWIYEEPKANLALLRSNQSALILFCPYACARNLYQLLVCPILFYFSFVWLDVLLLEHWWQYKNSKIDLESGVNLYLWRESIQSFLLIVCCTYWLSQMDAKLISHYNKYILVFYIIYYTFISHTLVCF